jgi:hypothetical protein
MEQKNTFLLRELAQSQLKFEAKVEEKLTNISNNIASLKEQKLALDDVKQKGKSDAFYKV